MPKNISRLPQYVIAVNITDIETNVTFDVFVMSEDADTWAVTTNVGDAFMFFNKDIAKAVAKDLYNKYKDDNDGVIFNHMAILCIKFSIEGSEELEF